MSDVFDLCDAVATRVDAGSYTIADSFTTESVPIMEVDADDIISVVKVSCVPRGKDMEPLSRAKDRNEVTIGVGVVKSVGIDTGKVSKADVSGLVELCEEIADQLRSEDYTVNGRQAKWMKTTIEPIYDTAALYSANQFRSVVNATYLMTTP